VTITDCVLKEMTNSFDQAITILPLKVGLFYLYTSIISSYSLRTGSIELSVEVLLLRTTSTHSGTRTRSFREEVRQRDGGCVLTGRPALPDRCVGLQATHIFPLAYEGGWKRCSLRNLITIPSSRESDGSINSVQNGILLSDEMHSFFDNYFVAINRFVWKGKS